MYGDSAVEPEDILVPDWDTNPLFLGTKKLQKKMITD